MGGVAEEGGASLCKPEAQKPTRGGCVGVGGEWSLFNLFDGSGDARAAVATQDDVPRSRATRGGMDTNMGEAGKTNGGGRAQCTAH